MPASHQSPATSHQSLFPLFRLEEELDDAAGAPAFTREGAADVLGEVVVNELGEDAVHRARGDAQKVGQLG